MRTVHLPQPSVLHFSCTRTPTRTHHPATHSSTPGERTVDARVHTVVLLWSICLSHLRWHVALRGFESVVSVTVVLLCAQVCVIRTAFTTRCVSRTPLHPRAQSAGAHIAASWRWRCHAGCCSSPRSDRFIPRANDGGDITTSSAVQFCARITHNFAVSCWFSFVRVSETTRPTCQHHTSHMLLTTPPLMNAQMEFGVAFVGGRVEVATCEEC